MSGGLRLWSMGLLLSLAFACAVPAAAQELVRTPFDDWVLRCVQSQPERCEIRQRLVNEEGKQVLDLAIGFDASKQSYPFVLELPLGFLIPPGVTLKIDESEEFAGLKVNRCLPAGCLVEMSTPQAVIDAMRRGQKGAFIVQTVDGKSLALVISLRGFTAAMNELVARNSRS